MQNVLENVLKRWKKYEHTKSLWLKKEKEEIDEILAGRMKIQRILRCGHCKQAVIAKGDVEIAKEYSDTISRKFICPECKNTIKQDWIYKPRISGIRR